MTRHLTTMPAALLLAAGLLAGALSGCAGEQQPQVATAGGGATTTASAAGEQPAADDEERMRRFAGCMREHGVDIPDPEPGGGPVRVGTGPGAADMAAMEAAMEACRDLLPNGGQPPKLSAEDLEKARAMAACLREHGVDAPDPDPDQGGAVMIPRGQGAPQVDQDALQQAFEACRHLGPQLGGSR